MRNRCQKKRQIRTSIIQYRISFIRILLRFVYFGTKFSFFSKKKSKNQKNQRFELWGMGFMKLREHKYKNIFPVKVE